MSLRNPVALGPILFIVLLIILLAGPFWQQGGLPTNAIDQLQHLHRIAAMERAFEQGVYWPRWIPVVYDGLGAPVFHHYSPGLYWLVAAIHRTGIGLDQALKLVVTAALLLGGLGGYAWLRYAFSPSASLVGAAFYLLHPHILTRSYYYAGTYPRLLALMLLPVCLWAITALYMRSRIRYWLTAVFSMVALVFSNALMAMVGAAVLAFCWLMLAIGYRRPGGLLRCALAALLAALLSAGFWLPALVDLSFVQFENARHGFFHYSGHFLSLWQLFTFQSPVLDSRAGNPPLPLITLGFGVASWVALLAGLISLFFTSRGNQRYWGLVGILFALTMLTFTSSISTALWASVPALGLVQFPYRFLSFAPLAILPAVALAIDAWPTNRRWLPAFGLMIVFFLSLFPYLFPAHTPLSNYRSLRELTAEDTGQFERNSFAWGTTGSDEFLVQGGNKSVITGQSPEPNATKPEWRTPHEAVVDLSGQTEPVLVRLHYHPAWSAGENATLTSGSHGWMQVTQMIDPAQPLELRWEGTPAQHWGERLNLVGILGTLLLPLLILYRRRLGQKSADLNEDTSPRAPLRVAALVGCVLVLVFVRYALDFSSGGPFIRHSPPGKLAFAVEGEPVTIGDESSSQVTLLGWQLLSSSKPKPGSSIRVRLFWQGEDQINEELHSLLHLYTPSLQRSWAVNSAGIGGRPDSRWWDPANYYVDDLRLTLPTDLPPASYSLVTGLFTSDGSRLTVHGSAENLLYLRTFDVSPHRPGPFQRERPDNEARAATDDGMRLQGYDLWPEAGSPTLRLFWETGEGVSNNWITYVHMHDNGGERVAQFDGPAIAGLQMTSQWHNNALYIDRRRLDLSEELEPGEYLLRIGLYDRVSGERLPFQPDDNTQGNFENGQLLVPVTIEPSSIGPD